MNSATIPSTLRRNLPVIGACLVVMFIAGGCASTNIKQREINVTGKIPRPDHFLVYDFVADATDIPADSQFAGQASTSDTPPTAEQLELGRELGAQIAAKLVEDIGNFGMSALRAPVGTQPRLNDIVIRGYLVSIEQGSAAKRMTIGFGSGGSELSAAVEGFQMTATGLRKLGSGTIGAEGSKGPGASLGAASWLITGNPVGLIVGGGVKIYGEASGSSKVEGRAKQIANEIADVLKQRCQQQGWIQ